MGIPTYFRFLMEKYKNIVLEEQKRECEYFFLDFNSILYKVFYDNERNKLNEDFFLYNIVNEVKRLCNSVMMMKDGNIVDSGTPEDLIKKYGQKNLEEVFLEIVRKDK